MSSTQALFTVRDYEQLPEGFPCELIEGHFVKEPAPYADHQRIISRLLFLIAGVIGPDRVLPSPVDIVIDDFNVLQPDVSVFSAALPRGARRPPLPTLKYGAARPRHEVSALPRRRYRGGLDHPSGDRRHRSTYRALVEGHAATGDRDVTFHPRGLDNRSRSRELTLRAPVRALVSDPKLLSVVPGQARRALRRASPRGDRTPGPEQTHHVHDPT